MGVLVTGHLWVMVRVISVVRMDTKLVILSPEEKNINFQTPTRSS